MAWNDSLDLPVARGIGRGRFSSFRFALVTTDGRPLGAIAYARPDLRPGDITAQGMRVVQVLDQGRDEQIRVLVVEPGDDDT